MFNPAYHTADTVSEAVPVRTLLRDSPSGIVRIPSAKEMKGIYTTSVSKETLDESPIAYKPMGAIVGKIGETVDVVKRIISVYNFKAGRNKEEYRKSWVDLRYFCGIIR